MASGHLSGEWHGLLHRTFTHVRERINFDFKPKFHPNTKEALGSDLFPSLPAQQLKL